jgi:hypothetical protein
MRKTIGVWRERVSGVASDVTHTFYSEPVSEGEMWWLKGTCVMNRTTAASTCLIYIDAGTHLHPLAYPSLTNENYPYFNTIETWLREGERLRFDWTGIASGEVLQAFIMGIKAHEIAI